jgi:Uma2 family endonuclease
MSRTAPRITRQDSRLLENGDRLAQPEFHRLYSEYPEDRTFELIGGVVYMASPLRRSHALYHIELSLALGLYQSETPGTELLDNPTIVLGEESEPQPDLALRVLTECRGRSRVTDEDYVQGPPELIAEVSSSMRAIDLHQKRADYEQAGVCEYLVLCVHEKELRWFDFRRRRTIRADAEGIYRSRVLPGLWLDGPALLERHRPAVTSTVRRGLDAPTRTAFVKRLSRRGK